MLIIGAVALIAFGPDQLPKVARKAGQVIRDVQNTSQSFIREMERAADEPEAKAWTPPPEPVHATTFESAPEPPKAAPD
jgi:Sec-independent protein translocase protein TatA